MARSHHAGLNIVKVALGDLLRDRFLWLYGKGQVWFDGSADISSG